MKRILFIFSSVFCITLLIACGGQTNETDNKTNQNNATQNNNNNNNNNGKATNINNSYLQNTQDQNEMKSKMKSLNFSEFDLEVSYAEQKDYEVEINHDNSGLIGGQVDDDLNNVHLRGKDAFDRIYSKVEKLTISKDTNKKDAIDQILKTFDLPANYIKFELEIIFNDGTSMEYND
ncbi:YusW family protein [Bacillus sp. S/N-304-OC-R1]|uniref:YusW family protein n=1 Tax=Bacillus sp. S/N-304-OC-R1 TaxID=2758034 RepID=UPI001C8DB6DD|nr:YusW family protein [Bacillus sp. S/N-304-OC-R1]MBY0123779.1 hypothetical protein [Bacillus sp. S/N-304-OC-R1]